VLPKSNRTKADLICLVPLKTRINELLVQVLYGSIVYHIEHSCVWPQVRRRHAFLQSNRPESEAVSTSDTAAAQHRFPFPPAAAERTQCQQNQLGNSSKKQSSSAATHP
jgi:hypothetical protein